VADGAPRSQIISAFSNECVSWLTAPHPLALLCARYERPRRRAAEQRYKRASATARPCSHMPASSGSKAS
jgi:hypothetical protein